MFFPPLEVRFFGYRRQLWRQPSWSSVAPLAVAVVAGLGDVSFPPGFHHGLKAFLRKEEILQAFAKIWMGFPIFGNDFVLRHQAIEKCHDLESWLVWLLDAEDHVEHCTFEWAGFFLGNCPESSGLDHQIDYDPVKVQVESISWNITSLAFVQTGGYFFQFFPQINHIFASPAVFTLRTRGQ